MIKAIFDAVWPVILPRFSNENPNTSVKFHRLGDILGYANAYVLIKHGINKRSIENIETFHVIGDPTLEIWGCEPQVLGINAGIWNGLLHIKMSECPEDAVITIWKNDSVLKCIKPSKPWEILSVDDLEADPPYSICFSAPGHLLAETIVEGN